MQANPVQLDACEKPSGRRVSIPILIRRITNMESKRPKKKVLKVSENEHSHGSFFLRIGAIVFGVGTVIYDGLEFGAFVESPADSPNSHLLLGVNPILHAILTFLQMYFIFISARLNIHKFKLIARFGLMHCLATNLCVWLRTLVRESIHEIQHHHTEDDYGNHDDDHHEDAYHGKDIKHKNHTLDTNNNHPNLWDLWSDTSCMDNGAVLKPFIDDFSPYLYPFLIEFSLIAAAVLYDSWSHVGFNPKLKTDQNDEPRTVHQKVKHMRVDCQGVFKGLFFGLFSLAIGILSMILYSVLSKKKETRWMGLILVDSVHCSLLLISLIAMVICITQTRSLSFNIHHHEELGGTLLRVTALGLFTYAALSNTAAALTVSDTVTGVKPAVVLITWLLTIIEVTVQTLFMSDMTRRRVSNPEQNHEKPGRQIITFLLVSNLTLWLLYTFEVQRLDTNPVQLKFYGFKPWAMILRITFPLCIFYRFHAAITYAEIWKNTYTYRAS